MLTRPLTEETLDDAKDVIRTRFGESACNLLDWEMKNPMRKYCSEAGDVTYGGGDSPMCFQAAVRFYDGLSLEVIAKPRR